MAATQVSLIPFSCLPQLYVSSCSSLLSFCLQWRCLLTVFQHHRYAHHSLLQVCQHICLGSGSVSCTKEPFSFKKTTHTHTEPRRETFLLGLLSLKLGQFPDLIYSGHTDSWATYVMWTGLTAKREECIQSKITFSNSELKLQGVGGYGEANLHFP